MDRSSLAFDTGGEQIARAAALQIAQNLDEQCSLQEIIWNNRDQDWAAAIGIAYQPTRIIRPQKSSIYLGAQPSLVAGENARFDKWPAVTCRCGARSPSADQADQWDNLDLELVIEVLAQAGPFAVDPLDDRSTSDAIDRQYQRLSDAVVACIDLDRSLGTGIPPISLPPRMIPSLPFVKREKAGAGRWLLYQGMELSWTVTGLHRVPGL